MDDDKLILKDSRAETYCISFLNAKGYRRDEIESIFSQFGPIASINETATDRGYRFVRYPSYAAAKNAVDGLRTHPYIKLIAPHDRKSAPANNSAPQQKKNERKNDRRNGRRQSVSDRDGFQGNEQFQQRNMKTPWEGADACGNNVSRSRGEKSVDDVWEERSVRSASIRGSSESIPLLIKRSSNNSGILDRLQDANSHDALPDLVSSRGHQASETNSQLQVLKAGEVIVGNIHPDYGSPYILHLMDPYEPIAITKIKMVPQTIIRYCHVYFKSRSQSRKVERQFDRMNLSQQKLIVIRPERLVNKRL